MTAIPTKREVPLPAPQFFSSQKNQESSDNAGQKHMVVVMIHQFHFKPRIVIGIIVAPNPTRNPAASILYCVSKTQIKLPKIPNLARLKNPQKVFPLRGLERRFLRLSRHASQLTRPRLKPISREGVNCILFLAGA